MAIVYCNGQNRSWRVVLSGVVLPPVVILEVRGCFEISLWMGAEPLEGESQAILPCATMWRVISLCWSGFLVSPQTSNNVDQESNFILCVSPKCILLGFNIHRIVQEFNYQVHWRKIVFDLFGSLPRAVHCMWKIPSLKATLTTNLIVSWLHCSCLIHCDSKYTVIPPYSQGVCSKTSTACLKLWIVLNSVYTMFIPIPRYL